MLFHDASSSPQLLDIHVTSRWVRLVRIAASVIRFVENCRRKRSGQPILVCMSNSTLQRCIKGTVKSMLQPLGQEELLAGEKVLLKQAQRDGFPEEVKVLELKRDLKSTVHLDKSSCLYKLRPIIDVDGIIRMDGRLALSETDAFDKKFPIILPRQHEVTKMIIQGYHEKFGHANRETVFNELRQRFYIPKLRTVIATVVKNCIWCRVYRCQPRNPVMAPLPNG